MLQKAITVLLLAVAAIHLLPVAGFFGRRRLEQLYGVEIDHPDLEVLLRHRAMLFGILGGFFTYAAFVPVVQPLAFVAAGASVGSFLYLGATVRGWGPAIRKIVRADLVAAACLAASIVLYGIGK